MSEQVLEEMIVAAPGLLSEEWMLIGRQVDTGLGGRVDLLAVAPDGSLILIELKRQRTSRDVVAQALDYASWLEKLRPEDVSAIYSKFAPGRSLAGDFSNRFGQPLDDESLNQTHQIIVVAESLDDSTERIVAYLTERDIPINILFFQVFANGSEQLLSRAWLLDPVRTQVSASTGPEGIREPWNGEFYASFGHGDSRTWGDAVRHGFISGGGGPWYSRTLSLLGPGDRVWVKVPGVGFVGVGRATGRVQPASSFMVKTPEGEKSILDVSERADHLRKWLDDPEKCEYFVPVDWLQTVPMSAAVQEVGMFGNQNTVCKPTTPAWRSTIERLKQRFPKFDDR